MIECGVNNLAYQNYRVMRTVSMIVLAVLAYSCQQKTCREVPAIADPVDVDIVRLEQDLFSATSRESIVNFLNEHDDVAVKFLHSGQSNTKAAIAGEMFNRVRSPQLDTLYREAIESFDKNESRIREELSTLYSRLNYYFPGSEVPQVTTMVTGLYNDLYIADDEVMIGLDYFIGPEATFKPLDVPHYILKRYTPRHMVPIIAKFVASARTRTGRESSLLSEMIDFGKVNYLVSRLLPCTPDSLIIGYDPDEMVAVAQNREVIWANFIENELLYDTSEFMKQKFLGERPNIYEISKNCPGRVGAWVGWEIVEAYMEKEQVSIQELLEETDHHMIFSKSNYRAING